MPSAAPTPALYDPAEACYLAAVLQLSSSSDGARSLAAAEDGIRAAAAAGAQLVATPENTNYLGPHEEKVQRAEPLDGPTAGRFAGLAAELGIHLLLGSFNERAAAGTRCHNTSVLFGPDGGRRAVYRKIHLFDVDLGPEVRFTESATVEPGSQPVLADTPLGRCGLSICYDLRFPELYRRLSAAGAELLLVPSAFTATTGRDHWHVLLRARAIENLSYVLAPAQWGRHDDEGLRESYGHAMIVDPWGTVLAECPDGVGFALAPIDRGRLRSLRAGLPALDHRRL